jgi:hypothetical protein
MSQGITLRPTEPNQWHAIGYNHVRSIQNSLEVAVLAGLGYAVHSCYSHETRNRFAIIDPGTQTRDSIRHL